MIILKWQAYSACQSLPNHTPHIFQTSPYVVLSHPVTTLSLWCLNVQKYPPTLAEYARFNFIWVYLNIFRCLQTATPHGIKDCLYNIWNIIAHLSVILWKKRKPRSSIFEKKTTKIQFPQIHSFIPSPHHMSRCKYMHCIVDRSRAFEKPVQSVWFQSDCYSTNIWAMK